MSFAAPRFLPRSVFSDDEKARQKGLLIVLVCVFTSLTILFALFAALIQPNVMVRGANSALFTLALGAVAITLSQRGFVNAGCWLFIAGNLTSISQRVVTGGGVHAPSISLYFIFALMAGTLLGRRASIATALAAILISLGVALAQRAGLLPAPTMPLTYLTDWWLNALCMVSIIFVVYLQALLMGQARLRLESELMRRRRMETHLNVALRAGAVGIWDSDLRSGRAWTDQRTATLFGVNRAKDGTVPFEEWTRMVHPEDRPKVDLVIRAMIERKASGKVRYRVILPDGHRSPCRRHRRGGDGEDGAVVSHVGTVIDITDRKRREVEREKNELERRALEEQLQQAQKREVMGTLAGGIAHDFNNLLAAIQNFASLIESDKASGAEAKQFAGRILAGCGRGRDIVAQILTFARTGVQQQEAVDLAAFLAETEPLLAQTVASGAWLALAAPPFGLWVEGNPGQLLQLITNLCVNAGEAMREEGGVIRVGLSACSPEEAARLAHKTISPSTHRIGVADPSLPYVLLTVADTGQGMSLQVLRRVFDPFFTTKGRHDGSGLGLSVCQGIIEGHGGFCVVESAPGKGTVFSVLLPAVPEKRADPASAADPGPAGQGQRPHPGGG